jgi:hypothetical protein
MQTKNGSTNFYGIMHFFIDFGFDEEKEMISIERQRSGFSSLHFSRQNNSKWQIMIFFEKLLYC